jgi:hypothetical protein
MIRCSKRGRLKMALAGGFTLTVTFAGREPGTSKWTRMSTWLSRNSLPKGSPRMASERPTRALSKPSREETERRTRGWPVRWLTPIRSACADTIWSTPGRLPTPIDSALVKAIARVHRWQRMLESGEFSSMTELAEAEKINRSYVCRVLRLTLLAPEIVREILDGRQGPKVTLARVLEPFPMDWEKQRLSLPSGFLLPHAPGAAWHAAARRWPSIARSQRITAPPPRACAARKQDQHQTAPSSCGLGSSSCSQRSFIAAPSSARRRRAAVRLSSPPASLSFLRKLTTSLRD